MKSRLLQIIHRFIINRPISGKPREGYEKTLTLARAIGKDDNVAAVLNNLGILHRDENRAAEARKAYEEALKIYRKLAERNPDMRNPEIYPSLATSLDNLGKLHHIEDRMAEARHAYEEALKIYRTFAAISPAAYEPYARKVQDNLDSLP